MRRYWNEGSRTYNVKLAGREKCGYFLFHCHVARYTQNLAFATKVFAELAHPRVVLGGNVRF